MEQVQVRVEVSRIGKNTESKFVQASITSDSLADVALEEVTAGLVDMIIRVVPEENVLDNKFSDYDFPGWKKAE